ncbi:MAG: amidohydrolase family protein [Oscillospiraceae bacterium]|nr:amidohydrolase family protein [Oscillospiraceae bacterium]
MKKIDYETHLSTKNFVEAKARLHPQPAGGPAGKSPFDMTLEERVDLMDRYEVQTQIVSCGGGLEELDRETALYVAKTANDEFAEMAVKYPGRFLGYATLVPQDIDASLRELERCHDDLGFPAWNTHTNFTDTYIDDDQYYPLLELAAKLDMFVYLHPGPPAIDRLNGYGTMLNMGLGYHVDTAITMTRLICKGVFDRLPNLKMMMGHYGETMPFMLDRMDSMAVQGEASTLVRKGNECNLHSMDYYFKHNIYVTTSGNFSKAAFICTRERLGMDHILFGTDFPIESYERTMAFLRTMEMTEEEMESLYFRNSQRVFGI